MKMLMVLTSHGVLGNAGLKTGCWLEKFVQHGAHRTL
jgi:hypothetical protein